MENFRMGDLTSLSNEELKSMLDEVSQEEKVVKNELENLLMKL